MRASVLKFGGSTFQSPDDFRAAARQVQTIVAQKGAPAVVVVSAMAGTTEELRAKLQEVNGSAPAAVVDALLPLADSVSAALLCAALARLGLRSATLYGHQLGLVTDSNFNRAAVQGCDAGPLEGALRDHDVLVVPGGQAVDHAGRPTWLGKNSSDLTAVLIASALELDTCEIYSDVPGIYSADPRHVARPQLLRDISYGRAYEIAYSGAKVLHPWCVRLAAERRVRLVCRSNRGDFRVGTTIGSRGRPSAIVFDDRSSVLAFASVPERARAVTDLIDDGVPVLSLAYDGEPVAVVTCGYFDAVEHLRRRGHDARELTARLVTELPADGEPVHHLVSADEAADFARELHQAVCA